MGLVITCTDCEKAGRATSLLVKLGIMRVTLACEACDALTCLGVPRPGRGWFRRERVL